MLRRFRAENLSGEARAAAEIEHMGENPAGRRLDDGVEQDLRAAIGQDFGQVTVEIFGILIEQRPDIGARRRSQAFAGKAGEAQGGAGGDPRGRAPSVCAESGGRLGAAVEPLERLAQPEPGRRPIAARTPEPG